MAKRATRWKEGKILSIETRKGVFVLAQMLKSPYLRFYKAFRKDEHWGKIDVSIFETLFTHAVVNQFLRFSTISIVKEAKPDVHRVESKIWIQPKRIVKKKVKLWQGTGNEREFYMYYEGGSLVENDLWWSPTPEKAVRDHPSGVIDKVILEDIPFDADEMIDEHELTNLEVFPGFNERLYLCYKFDKKVDPYKELIFNREIPKEYNVYIDIISLFDDKEKRKELYYKYFMHPEE